MLLQSSARPRTAHATSRSAPARAGFHGQLGLGGYDASLAPSRVGSVERGDASRVELYRAGAADDVQLAVVAAGSSHTASISRRCDAPPCPCWAGAGLPPFARRAAASQPLARQPGAAWPGLTAARPPLRLPPRPVRRGELYTWGLASSGELGHGGWTPIEVCVPRQITSLLRTRIVSVCAGANHSLAISEAGQLWSCGRGRHGQLGHAHFHDEGVLTLVEAIRCAPACRRPCLPAPLPAGASVQRSQPSPGVPCAPP